MDCKLNDIFTKQAQLTSHCLKRWAERDGIVRTIPLDLNTFQGQQDMRNILFHLVQEMTEYNDSLSFFTDSFVHNAVNQQEMLDAAYEELADVFTFSIEALILAGISPNTIKDRLGALEQDGLEAICKIWRIYKFNKGHVYGKKVKKPVLTFRGHDRPLKVRKDVHCDVEGVLESIYIDHDTIDGLGVAANHLGLVHWRNKFTDIEAFNEGLLSAIINVLDFVAVILGERGIIDYYESKLDVNLERVNG